MKPQQPDVAYCIKNADFVNGLLEERGWQKGDWYWQPEAPEEVYLAQLPEFLIGEDDLVWIPTEGDVLGMLDERNTMPALESNVQKDERDLFWIARAGRSKSGWQKTPLIALLELLRAVEGTG